MSGMKAIGWEILIWGFLLKKALLILGYIFYKITPVE